MGLSLRNIAKKVRDVFDANTQADQQKRLAAGQARMYADQQRALGNQRPAQNVGQAFLGNTARLVNTVGGLVQETPGTLKATAGLLTNNQKAINNAVAQINRAQQRTRGTNSGLFGAGTIYNSPNEKLLPGETGKRFAGTYTGAVGETFPIPATKAITGSNLLIKAGKVGLASGTANVAADAGNQIIQTGKVDPKKSAVAFGTGLALGTAAPIAGKGIAVAGKALAESDRKIAQMAAQEAPKAVKTPKPTASLAQPNAPSPKEVKVVKPDQVPTEVTNRHTLQGEFQTAFVDREAAVINYLKNLDKQDGGNRTDKFMYDVGLQRRSNAVANAKVTNSDNINKAFSGLEGPDKANFDAYVAAKQELANSKRGMDTSVPVAELKATVKQNAQFEDRFKSLNQYYKQWAKDLHAAGIIDDQTLKRFNSNNNYTHVQRVMDDLAIPRTQQGTSFSFGRSMSKFKRTGSTRDVQPADVTAFKYGQDIQNEIQRNQTASNLIDVLLEQGHAKRISVGTRKNTLSRIVNGKTEIYEVPRDIREVAENVSPYQLGILGRIVSAPQRLLRAGATGLSVPFTAANYVKDQASSAIFSKDVQATHAPANIFTGLLQSAKDFGVGSDDKLWQEFIKHSGDATQYDFIRNLKNARQLSREVRLGQAGRTANRIINPIRTLEDLNQITEKATRFQNFKGTYEAAIKEGLTKEQATQKATLAAWQNSVDFSRMGNISQGLNLLIPYFNAGIQGTRLLGRRMEQDPVGTSAKTVMFLGLPLAALTFHNLQDDKRKKVYDNISTYEKENNIVIVTDKAKQNADGSYSGVYKIPIQPGISNLIQPIRISIESFKGKKPNDFKKMAQEFAGALAGPVNTDSVQGAVGSLTPQVVKPVAQQIANKDFFTGKQIVPDYIEKSVDAQGNPIPAGLKAYPYSSGSLQIAGKKTNQSPIRMEKFIKDTSGKVGLYTLNAVDNVLAKKGIIPKDQIGGVSVKEDMIRRFAVAQGIENYNKSEGAKYFDKVKAATSKLNPNEMAAFTSLHPAKKNFLGDTITETDSTYNPSARLDIYNRYPKVFEADKQLDAKSKVHNPLFGLESWQVKKVLEKDALPPGTKDPELSQLYSKDWYADYKNKQTKYFQDVRTNLDTQLAAAKKSGNQQQIKSAETAIQKFDNPSNPYPQASKELQSAMDYYNSLPKGTGARSNWIKNNQGTFNLMKDQWAKVDGWQNNERVARGLDATEGATGAASGYASSGSSGYSSGGGGSKTAGSAYKYAVSINAGKGKAKVSTPRAKISTRTARAYKASKPKVSIKKSQV